MPQLQISKFRFRELVRLPCAWCEGPMYLAQIEPVKPGNDLHVYECPRCGNVTRTYLKIEARSRSAINAE
jgi:hypothetical protein